MKAKKTCLSTALVSSLLLVACGGGGGGTATAPDGGSSSGGGSGGGSSSGSGNRIKRIIYDYDNNGVTDAIDTLTYDTAGRVTMYDYAYSGDGEVDRYQISATDNSVSYTSEFRYDSFGRIELWEFDNLAGGAAFRYDYDSIGNLVRQRIVSMGVEVGAYSLAYSGSQIDTIDFALYSSPGNIRRWSFSYDALGLPITATQTFTLGSFTDTLSYTWRSDGNMERSVAINSNGETETFEISYDTNGLPVGEVQNIFESPGRLDVDYTATFTRDADGRVISESYDALSDGSIDAVADIEWESGPCEPVFVWTGLLYDGGGFPLSSTYAFTPGTGYQALNNCLK